MSILLSVAGLIVTALAAARLRAKRIERRERLDYLAAKQREAERLYELASSRLRSQAIKSYRYD